MEIRHLNVEDIKAIRHQVLWPHLTEENCAIDADFLSDTFHLGVIKNGLVIATSTFVKESNSKFKSENQYRLRAMATLPDYRKLGIGKEIIMTGIDYLKNQKMDILWCDARIFATGFYKKIGFNSIGKTYEKPNVGPHKLMYIELN